MIIQRKFIIAAITWGTLALIILISYILWAFDTWPKGDVPNVSTNNIIAQEKSLPDICQKTIHLIDCIMSSDLLTWDKTKLNQHYLQTISQRNTLTDADQFENSCSQYYNYIIEQKSWYQNIIQSCI